MMPGLSNFTATPWGIFSYAERSCKGILVTFLYISFSFTPEARTSSRCCWIFELFSTLYPWRRMFSFEFFVFFIFIYIYLFIYILFFFFLVLSQVGQKSWPTARNQKTCFTIILHNIFFTYTWRIFYFFSSKICKVYCLSNVFNTLFLILLKYL